MGDLTAGRPLDNDIRTMEENMSQNRVGPDATLDGRIHSRKGLLIDGRVKGQVSSAQVVRIGETGNVEGAIQATNVEIEGSLHGELSARKELKLGPLCHVRANLAVQPESLVVHEDADLGNKDDD